MNECDFCDVPLDDNGKTFTRKEMLNITSGFSTLGDFTKHCGFSNIILAKMHMKFNNENANVICLCSDCAGKLPNKTLYKKWYQFWK